MAMGRAGFVGTRIRDIHKSLVNRELSVQQLCQHSLRIIDKIANLNSFISICNNEALDKARSLDKWLKDTSTQTDLPNLLFGIPISIKDNFCTRDLLTTCGSRMLSNFIPPYDAKAVSDLKRANYLLMGKTNMDEFAMGSSSTTSYYGPAANQIYGELLKGQRPTKDTSTDWFMAGGSSTGSAVSVATGACFASLGTDTGGSTRQPASLTGVVGFKPSYGLISRHGLVPLVHCLDVVSILARYVDDVRIVFDTIVGMDPEDLTSVDHDSVLVASHQEVKPRIKIGVPREFISKGEISPEVGKRFDEVLDLLSKEPLRVGGQSYEIINLDLNYSSLATECYTIISSAEIASNMSCYDGVKYGFSQELDTSEPFNRDNFFKSNRDNALGDEVKKRILLGNYFLLSENRDKYLVQAQKLRRLISEDFGQAFEDKNVDIIMTPSTPTTSVSFAEWSKKQMDNRLFHEDYFLIPSNLANLPSISLPAGKSADGLPIGIQFIANSYHDRQLLAMSEIIESSISPLFSDAIAR